MKSSTQSTLSAFLFIVICASVMCLLWSVIKDLFSFVPTGDLMWIVFLAGIITIPAYLWMNRRHK